MCGSDLAHAAEQRVVGQRTIERSARGHVEVVRFDVAVAVELKADQTTSRAAARRAKAGVEASGGVRLAGLLDRDAIATRLERAYDQSFANACEDYVGPECDCDFAPLVPRCVESKCRAVQSPEPNRYALERRGANVVVTPVYRSCAQDSDCTLVATSCAGCCERDAITAALESTYDENLTPACADYRGGICDCSVLPAKARCIDDVCTHVPTN